MERLITDPAGLKVEQQLVAITDAAGNIISSFGGGGGGGAEDLLFTDDTDAQFIYRDSGATPPVFTAYLIPAGTAYTVGANPRPYAVRDVKSTVADGADAALGAKADVAASSDTGTFSLMAFVKRALQNWTTFLARMPALGAAAKAAAVPVTMATDQPDIGVALHTLISGEDQTNSWIRQADGAGQFYVVAPTVTAGGRMPNSDVLLGATGAAGDYLKALTVRVDSAANAAVYLNNGAPTVLNSGTSGTNPAAGTVTQALVATASFSATADQYQDAILSITYTPTGSAAAVKCKRRVVSHAVVSASTAISVVMTHPLPAGATITAWSLESPASSWEVLPFNTLPGAYTLPYGAPSTLGAWKVSVDLGAQLTATGKFT